MDSVSKKAAFTLIELLVVISIILIATSILFVGGGGGNEGVKLSSAQRIVSSVAQGARGQALLKSSEARIIIYSEDNTGGDPEKLLRYFGVVYEDPENEGQWFAATQGTYLPEGIYFDPGLSEDNSDRLGSLPTMNLEYPRQSSQPEGGPEYYYYAFDANGTMTTSPDDFVNAWLVLRAGTLMPDPDSEGGGLTVNFDQEEKENLKSALIFRRVGSTTLVDDPSEISGN